jgi:hypothetical protein
MKVGPSHLMRAYVAEYARPEKARETMRGAPSPWKVLATMPKQVEVRARRLQVSNLESTADMVDSIVVAFFSEMYPHQDQWLNVCILVFRIRIVSEMRESVLFVLCRRPEAAENKLEFKLEFNLKLSRG